MLHFLSTDFWHCCRLGAQHDRSRGPHAMGAQIYRPISWSARQWLYIVVARRSRLHRHHSSQSTRLDRLAWRSPETNARTLGDRFPRCGQGVWSDEVAGSTRWGFLPELSQAFQTSNMCGSPPHVKLNKSMRIADLCKVESLSTSLKTSTKPTHKKQLLMMMLMSLFIEPWCGGSPK